MKNIILLLALIPLTIFTACSNQKMENDLELTNEKISKFPRIDNKTTTPNDYTANIGKADFTVDNEGDYIDEGDVLLFSNNSVNAVSYHWDFGNGDTSMEFHPNYQYEIHGNRTITPTVTDSFGKTHQTSNEVIVLCVFGGGDHNQ